MPITIAIAGKPAPFGALRTNPSQDLQSISNSLLGGRFEYFLFFSAWGGDRVSPRRRGGGGIGLLKMPGGGGEGPCRTGGAEDLGGCLWRVGEFGG